ncbi:MAG: Hpt domain-containing protein [Polyangiaceae bacterium]|jgi:HPt (histidine-containing phosphotransfer) domain-containing protein
MTFDTKPASPQAARSRIAAALLPRFVGHRERDVVTIRLALEHGDFETVARLGHNMRGNGISYGFPDISAIGERLETAAGAKDEGLIREALEALETWVTEIRSKEET